MSAGERAGLEVRGSLWLAVDGEPLGGHGRMALLRAVQEQGSITRAAQAFGMSYKAAWEAIDAMNRVAGAPLVERVTGGKGGGATRLTERGRRLLERHALVDAVHQRFVRLLSHNTLDLDEDFSLLQVLNVKTSARNQWLGRVHAVATGAVNDGVTVDLDGGRRLEALVTSGSSQALGLREGRTVLVLAKASAVMLATGLGDARLSADNRLDGTVAALRPGAVQAEVTVTVPAVADRPGAGAARADAPVSVGDVDADAAAPGGAALTVVAMVPMAAVADLGLAPGAAVSVLLKSSELILATLD